MTASPAGPGETSARLENTLSERLDAVRAEIAEAASESGRSVSEITTVVVTKFHPGSLLEELVELGVRDIGESRHQEARAKAQEASDLDLTWHFVGQVQSKKVRQIAAYSSVIHSIDRESLLDSLSSPERTIDCFLQLNLTDDPSRGGVRPDALLALAEHALNTPGIQVRGVMAIAPLGEEPRVAFSRVREASELLHTLAPHATDISMGMSGDFREAILEGATHLRIGTAITGKRPPAS